jgi:serine protease Do
VEKQNSLNVTLDDGSSFKAKIIATSPEYDLAIIKIDFNEHFIIGFRSQKTTLDLPVTLIGFPADTNTAAMNFGSITKIDQELKGHPVYQLDITANQGNSGGPVVDQTGQFVGMLTYGLSDVEIDKLNFAITAETVAKFINDNLK